MSTPSEPEGRRPDDGRRGGDAGADIVSARILQRDIDRLDQAATRRGVAREDVVAQAIDAFLAREMWSGGFIDPPPPMEIPGKFPWGAGALRIRRRRRDAR